MAQQGATVAEKAEYTIDSTLPNGLVILRKTSGGPNADGERFLGCFLPSTPNPSTQKMSLLDSRGAGDALMNLLNHENLVNLQTTIVQQPINGTGQSRPQTLVVWDWCDAGTLQDLLYDPPVLAADGHGFLPEGLVWHVALGVLRALQWLHEGVRDTYTVKGPLILEKSSSSKNASYRTRCEKVRGTTVAETDWWPILHRDITPGNIFFQHPRGIETYGPVKLGNFEKAFVSGAVNRGEGFPFAVSMDGPENDVGAETLKHKRIEYYLDPASVPRVS